MREIKFRSWNVLAGVMTSLSNISLPNTTQGDGSPYLLQFTGVKDHKGVEIYEGDIVRFNHWVYDQAKRRRMRSFGSIEVDGDCWVISSRRYFGSLWDITSKEVLEVVGNIYEHDVNVLTDETGGEDDKI